MKLISSGGFDFRAYGLEPYTPPSIKNTARSANYIRRGAFGPSFAGITTDTRVIPWYIEFPNSGSLDSWRTVLFRGLRFDRNQEVELVAEDDSGQRLVVLARPRDLQHRVGRVYDLTFETGEPEWRSEDTSSATVTGPAIAGGSLTLNVLSSGTARTRPVIIAEYILAKTNQPIFSQQYSIERTGSLTVDEYPYTLTFDHEALVNAGKSLASGLDILVFVDGAEVARTLAGADTATASVTFPLTMDAAESLVEIRYAAAGQTYGLGSYFKANHAVTVTNVLATALTDYPYQIIFNHAAQVTATRSNADGDDIRVFVNGIESNRAVVAPNTTTTDVWFPLTVAANGSLLVELRMGNADFSGVTYTNGSLNLTLSDNTNWVYSTPLVDTTSSDTPGLIRAIAKQVNGAFSIAPGYSVTTSTQGADPTLLTAVNEVAPQGNGNYIRFYAGGVRLASLKTAVAAQDSANDSIPRIADSSDGSTYTSRYTFTEGVGSVTVTAYATYALSASATHVIAGVDINDTVLNAGATTIAHWYGQGSSELTLVLNTDDTPDSASHAALSTTTGSELFTNTIDATLSDELNHSLQIRGLSLTENQQLKIDAGRRRISILNALGSEVSGSASIARDKLTISSPDSDWLALEPDDTTTLTWTEENLDANGLTLTAEVSDAWH